MKSTYLRKNMLFIVGAIMLGLSLTLSTFSAIKVMSAPLAAVPAPVTVPSKVGFEGYLAGNDDGPISGTHTLEFNLYGQVDDQCLGDIKWTEQQSVTVNNGLYAVQLGAEHPLTPTLFNVPNGKLCLGVSIDSDPEMSPRTKISSVPFALNAEHANTAENAVNATNADTVANYPVATSGIGSHVLATDSSGGVTVSDVLNVGTAVTSTSGTIAYSGGLKPVRGGNTYTGYVYVPVAEMSGTGLNGGALNVGTYSFGPTGSGTTYTFAYPATAKALVVRISATFANTGADKAFLRPYGTTETNIMLSTTENGVPASNTGIVNLDYRGRGQIIIQGGQNASGVTMRILGYFF